MSEPAHEFVDDNDHRRWSPRLRARDVFILGAVSALLFLWTRHPAMGAVLPLLMSGRKCWNVGWWLFDRDPERRRALTVLTFYIAWAGWQAAAAAFATVIGCLVLEENGWLDIPEARIMWTLAVMGLALVWNGVLCCMALIRALRHHQKIWLSPNLVEQCDRDFTRLQQIEWNPRSLNRAVFVIAAGVGFPVLILFSVVLAAVTIGGGAAPQNESLVVTLLLLGIAAMFILPIVLVSVLVHRVAASSPSQCWCEVT